MAAPSTAPAGRANRSTRRRKLPCSVVRPPGPSASRKPGTPTVNVAASDRWRGSSGNSAVHSPNVAITKAANTDLVTNSLATRCTLLMILRPSPTASGMAPKRSVTSTLSATLLASCVPLPRATASRAPFIAGTSLTPSPIIAT